ncbi:NADPH:quinone reductase [Asanoa hainanensis]|uniref:NADPH:quinone reductase n=1 Tax=Asanoa hainanensis TaxID=560556 RepID=A0A239GFZ8_9ACTN|nr:zinc-binding alcohol dehydrogenase family protein [Asanoa hainanensis]SNS68117.1 NADPH:quinone reductase [Asanoa hainanensis]
MLSFADGAASVVTVSRPEPAAGRVLVRTEAVGAGVGLLRALAADTPGSPGGEIVGTVVVVGSGVDRFAVGDRVGGVVFADAYAEFVVADPRLISAIPPEVAPGVAVAVVRGGLVELAASRTGRFSAGESVLVTAAASGVGHLAVQLARALGAGRVVGAMSSPDKSDFVRSCGADAVVTYDEPAWGDPVDLVLDGAGGPLVARGIEALSPFGRLVAFSAGGGSVDAGALLPGMKTVTALTIGTLHRTRPSVVEDLRAELWALLAAGHLDPRHVDLPFDAAADAVALLANRANPGRVALLS